MSGAPHGQHGLDVTNPKPAPNAGRVVAAIPKHTVRPLSRSHPFGMQIGNRIHHRQGFLRVVPVCGGQRIRRLARA